VVTALDVIDESVAGIKLSGTLTPLLTAYNGEKDLLEEVMIEQLKLVSDRKDEVMRQSLDALRAFSAERTKFNPSSSLTLADGEQIISILSNILTTLLSYFNKEVSEIRKLPRSLLERFEEQEVIARKAALVLCEEVYQRDATLG